MAANEDVDWYDSEESTGRAMARELQRIRMRFLARWWVVVGVAALLTGAVYKKLSSRVPMHEAQVVLALTEEALSTKERRAIPVDDLRQYVMTVLMPAKKLEAMIEKRNLFPLRKQLGTDFALSSLWEQTEISIWKNDFGFYEEGDERTLRSARIGIAVSDTDPDRAFGVARDLAAIVIDTSDDYRTEISATLAGEVAHARTLLERRQRELDRQIAEKLAAKTAADADGRRADASALELAIGGLYREQKRNSVKLSAIDTSSDAIADRINEAGLDMAITVVDEQPPERDSPRTFVTILVMVVVGFGALFGCALVLGAFDPRIHDTEDIDRLALPVLGHVPGFPGDQVGSLAARGAAPSRVPSFLRWRSHR